MTMIADILDRLSGIEVVKERLRAKGARVEQWATQVVVRGFGGSCPRPIDAAL